jgi:hypothetical protein
MSVNCSRTVAETQRVLRTQRRAKSFTLMHSGRVLVPQSHSSVARRDKLNVCPWSMGLLVCECTSTHCRWWINGSLVGCTPRGLLIAEIAANRLLIVEDGC